MNRDLISEFRRLAGALDDAHEAQKEAVRKAAEAERDYRKGKAMSWVQVKNVLPNSVAKEREAWVDSDSSDLRFLRDLAEGEKTGAVELIRTERAKLSALQTIANVEREEAAFARTGPR